MLEETTKQYGADHVAGGTKHHRYGYHTLFFVDNAIAKTKNLSKDFLLPIGVKALHVEVNQTFLICVDMVNSECCK